MNITTSLATEDDAYTLASIMTAAFAASDASYPLIWPSDDVHTDVCIKGLLSPVQQEGRPAFKAMVGEKIVGFAIWDLPKPNAPKASDLENNGEKKKDNSLPDIPGVNTELWGKMLNGLQWAAERDFEPSEDLKLLFFFVHPDYHCRGIGSLLLQWGLKKADELKAKIWLTSTPQAISVYEKNGWKVVERCDIDLGSGGGMYKRAWMLRQPAETV